MSHAAPSTPFFTGEKDYMIGEEVRRTADLCYTYDDDDDIMRVYTVAAKAEKDDDDEEEEEEDEERNKGVLIGRLQSVRELINGVDEVWLSSVDVAPHMQRQGIGRTLVELTMEFELSHVPAVRQHESYQYSLSTAGERLVARCVENGIIPVDLCYFSSALKDHRPWSSALLKSNDENGDQKRVDPQLDSSIVLHAIANRKAGIVTPSTPATQDALQ